MSAPPKRQRPQRSWTGLLVPAVLAFAVLVGLGTWQIQRKAWKEGLIASLTERLAGPPPLSRNSTGSATNTAASRSIMPRKPWSSLRPSTFRPDVSGPGYWVFTPARLADGSVVIVNRGFVSEGRQDAFGSVALSLPLGLIFGRPEPPLSRAISSRWAAIVRHSSAISFQELQHQILQFGVRKPVKVGRRQHSQNESNFAPLWESYNHTVTTFADHDQHSDDLVTWNGIGIPLIWTLLPTAGNSNSAERTGLRDRLCTTFKDVKIAALIGDREFIGERLDDLSPPAENPFYSAPA